MNQLMERLSEGNQSPAFYRRRVHGVGVGGFTLIELLVVLSLLSILMGLGVGMLRRRGSDLDVARTILRDQVRLARETAAARHVPCEVVFEGQEPGQAIRVKARRLEAVAHWHMESDQSFDFAPSGTERVGSFQAGRFGEALRPLVDDPKSGLRISVGRRNSFDLSEGFVFRMDVRLDEREEMTLLRFGTSVEWTVDPDMFLRARVTPTTGGGTPGAPILLQSDIPLRQNQWHALDLIQDGRRVSMRIDDREVAAEPSSLPLLQTAQDVLVVSAGDQPVFGLIDSVQLWAYAEGDEQAIPATVRFVGGPPRIRFDDRGLLEVGDLIELEFGDLTETLSVTPTGAIQ